MVNKMLWISISEDFTEHAFSSKRTIIYNFENIWPNFNTQLDHSNKPEDADNLKRHTDVLACFLEDCGHESMQIRTLKPP